MIKIGLASTLSNPNTMIQNIILIVLAAGVLVVGLPLIITSIINLSVIPNLGFASFFSAGGVVLLGLGAAIVLGVLALIGVGRSRR